ncbi:MAG: PAS domain-containing protein [Alphaproteobacteria bacterium]|nr:PAS domain-containing protein [Alphaproteobacteria bacterium]
MTVGLPHREIVTGDSAIGTLVHPVLRALADYWQSKRRRGGLPRLGDLDPPMEIPRLTAHMSILAIEGDPPRFRYRRMGSAIVQDRRHRRIKDATGHYADEVDFHLASSDVIGAMTDVTSRAVPYREHGQYESGDYALLHYEWVILPLAGETARVSFLMTGYVTFAGE